MTFKNSFPIIGKEKRQKERKKIEEEILRISDMTKLYQGKVALNHVSISIKQGQIYGLVGNNGAGKTTLMRMITGTAFWDGGSLQLFGKEQSQKIGRERKRLGSLLETPAFFENLTGRQNLEYYRIQLGIPGKQGVEELLMQVGLSEAAEKKVKGYSLGMKQRLGIALALLNHPDFLILDEPINGLDPKGIIEIRNTLLRLNREKGVTILISSHILAELTNLATYFCFMDKGKILEEISREALEEKCQTYLELKVSDGEKMSVLLEQNFPKMRYRVYPQNVIHIYENQDKAQEISQLAVQNGIGLLGLSQKTVDLENYYMNMVGEDGSAERGSMAC